MYWWDIFKQIRRGYSTGAGTAPCQWNNSVEYLRNQPEQNRTVQIVQESVDRARDPGIYVNLC